jgi:hypothetical protein
LGASLTGIERAIDLLPQASGPLGAHQPAYQQGAVAENRRAQQLGRQLPGRDLGQRRGTLECLEVGGGILAPRGLATQLDAGLMAEPEKLTLDLRIA